MRIAIFHDLPSGGAKRSLYETMKRLSQRHTLDIYTLDTSDQEFYNLKQFSNEEYVFHFKPLKPFRSPLGRLNQLQRWVDLQKLDRLARQIAKKIDARNYDAVLAHPCMWTQAPLILQYLKTPAIYYCHEPPRHLYGYLENNREASVGFCSKLDAIDPFISLYRTTARQMDKSATFAAHLVLVNSIFIREQVNQIYGLDPTICYLGVDTDEFHPEQVSKNGSYVLSVGAIQPHKGFDFLIEGLGYVSQGIRPPLYLVGNMENPGEREILQSLAKEKGVDLHIELRIDSHTLIRRYNEAVLVAYTPYNEPFGLVPLEAMACGRPVVGINEGGVRETVKHELTGLLVERDPVRLGKAIQVLLEDPKLAKNFGINGRKYVLENWNWERAVAELERHLEKVLL